MASQCLIQHRLGSPPRVERGPCVIISVPVGVCEWSCSGSHWVFYLSCVLELRLVKCLELLRTGVLLVLFLWSPFHFFRCLQLPSAFKVILPGDSLDPTTPLPLLSKNSAASSGWVVLGSLPSPTWPHWLQSLTVLLLSKSFPLFQFPAPLLDQFESLSYFLPVFWMSLGHWYFSDFTSLFHLSPVCCFLINKKHWWKCAFSLTAPHPHPGQSLKLGLWVLSLPFCLENGPRLEVWNCVYPNEASVRTVICSIVVLVVTVGFTFYVQCW